MAGKMTLDEAGKKAERLRGELKKGLTLKELFRLMKFSKKKSNVAKGLNPNKRKQMQEAMKEN